MPDFLALAITTAPFLSLAAFGFASWYFLVATRREPAKVVKR